MADARQGITSFFTGILKGAQATKNRKDKDEREREELKLRQRMIDSRIKLEESQGQKLQQEIANDPKGFEQKLIEMLLGPQQGQQEPSLQITEQEPQMPSGITETDIPEQAPITERAVPSSARQPGSGLRQRLGQIQEQLPPGGNLRVGPLTIPGPQRPATGISGLQEQIVRDLATDPQTGRLDPNVAAGIIQRLRTNPQGAESRIFDIRFRQSTGRPVAPGELEAIDAFKEDLFGIGASRTGGGETGRLGVRKTPEFQQTEADVARARAEGSAEGRPLEASIQKDITGLGSIGRHLQVIRNNFDPNFLGPIKGTEIAFEARRRVGSSISAPVQEQEVLMRQSLIDVSDQLLRARSGAQINEQEFKRMIKILPRATDEPQVFLAGLKRFETELQNIIAEKLKLGTTPRGKIQGGVGPTGGKEKLKIIGPIQVFPVQPGGR